jgi:NADPH:quinone reductase-like Zn-dependent oxidoreductase
MQSPFCLTIRRLEVKMKAVVYDKINSPNALVLREVEKPIPNDNEVLVKIVTVSVNAADYRSMNLRIIPKRKIFGSDIAGRIEAVGRSINQFTVGDEVFGDISSFGFGGFAEYVVVPEHALALKPAGVPFETAAAVPMAAVTALQALRNKGNIQPGQKVLICGAGGGVGTFAVQLAKHFGAEVTAVCGEKNVKVIQSIGADYIINYHENDFTKSDKHYDLILSLNGNHPLNTYKRLLAPKGIYVMVGGDLSQVFKSLLFGAFMSIGDKKMRSLAAKPNRKDLEFIIKLVADGKVKPVIDRQYPLHETAEAMRYISGGHALGKVIIQVVS